MTQVFSTSDSKHSFSVDGVAYYLPAVSVDDIVRVTELAKMEPAEQVVAFRNFLIERAVSERRTFWQWLTLAKPAGAAVASMSIPQISELFKAWVTLGQGLNLGESSSSSPS